jgi:hypothetical protein
MRRLYGKTHPHYGICGSQTNRFPLRRTGPLLSPGIKTFPSALLKVQSSELHSGIISGLPQWFVGSEAFIACRKMQNISAQVVQVQETGLQANSRRTHCLFVSLFPLTGPGLNMSVHISPSFSSEYHPICGGEHKCTLSVMSGHLHIVDAVG